MKRSGFAILMIISGLISVKSAAQESMEVKTLEIGQTVPGFDLPGIDDRNYTVNDFSQYPFLVIMFTCNHCPTAQAYEDRIIELVKYYRPKGVGFVAIMPNSITALSLSELGYTDMGDDLPDMKIRARDKGYNFPYLFDGADQKVSLKFGPVATPHVFVFDKDRKLRYSGRIDDTENPYISPNQEDLKEALDALLSNKSVPVEQTKTFGCSVKWAWKDQWTKQQLTQWANEPVSLNSLDGEGIRSLIQNNSTKLRLVNIWATWCGPCVIEFPELININRMYRGRDFELVTISADKPDKSEKALDFLKKNQASFKNYIFSKDDKYELIEAVDESWQGALPYTLLIAPGGKIISRIPDAFDPLKLKRQIVDYLGRYYADDK
jgi:thiol-disulfide isomerase/thioredoxin